MTAPRGRRPGKPDTRGAILASARAEFAANGYGAASLRAIARRAQVDAALVHHYFPDKRHLFLASWHVQFDPSKIAAKVAAGGPRGFGVRLMSTALTVWESPLGETMLGALRAALSAPDQIQAVGGFIAEEIVHAVLAPMDIPARQRPLRTALIETQMIGVVIGRYVLGVEPLASLSREQVVALVGPVLQHALTGPLSPEVP